MSMLNDGLGYLEPTGLQLRMMRSDKMRKHFNEEDSTDTSVSNGAEHEAALPSTRQSSWGMAPGVPRRAFVPSSSESGDAQQELDGSRLQLQTIPRERAPSAKPPLEQLEEEQDSGSSVRIGAEYQAVLPAMGQAPRGKAPREPRLIYAPSSSESRDGQEAGALVDGADQAYPRAAGQDDDRLLAQRFFTFPLPISSPTLQRNRHGSSPHELEGKRLNWQVEWLGFVRHTQPIPEALRAPARERRPWSVEERR
eukprot:scaffold160766_cov27-Tisochrysis_lutea.AAC.1